MTAQTATIAEQSAQIDAQIDALTDAVLEERERCAVLCDNEAKTREEAAHATHGRGTPAYGRQMAGITAAKNCARAIRNPAK